MAYLQHIIPPEDFVPVADTTPTGDVTLPENCRGLVAGTEGFINVTMRNGERRDGLPLCQGINPGFFATVHETTGQGAAENIWAIGSASTGSIANN